MGKLDDVLKKIVDETDGGVACGVVDLNTGMLMGIHNASNYPAEMNDLVAAAAMDLFRGKHLQEIQKMVRMHRGVPEDGANYFEEIHIASKHNFHFAKTFKGDSAMVMLVTNKSTNIGMGWAKLRQHLPEIDQAF